MHRSRPWRPIWMVASLVWIVAVALYASKENDRQAERLNRWAAAVEAVINADPMVRTSAKELRTKLGDEQFIAAAPAAYPQVDLRETLRGYTDEMSRHPVHKHLLATLATWALGPPLCAYGLGVLAEGLIPVLRRRLATGR